MAELLVRVRDKTSPDIYKDVRLTKRGDVIVVMPDGWTWGSGELTNPDWRILKLPNVSVEEASAMLGGELPIDPQAPSRTLQRRAFSFDLDNLPQSVAGFIADDTRKTPALTVNLTLAQFRGLKKRKEAKQDPAILSSEPKVIG